MSPNMKGVDRHAARLKDDHRLGTVLHYVLTIQLNIRGRLQPMPGLL